MITQEQQKQGAELMKTLIGKAWESAAFKDQLVKNPAAAIESVTGSKAPENTKYVVEDQTDKNIIYFNIPRKLNLDNLELTDEQLEVVAGGEVLATAAALATIGAFGIAVGYALGHQK